MEVCPGTSAVANFSTHKQNSDNLCETNFDPLLKNGTFIDSNCGGSPRSRTTGFNNEATTSTAIGNSNFFESDTQMAGKPQSSVVDTPVVSKRVYDHPGDSPAVESPNWLPPGWVVKNKIRISGSTAGSTDKYYVDPVSGHNFRSKNEVLFFLENGWKRKRAKDNPEGQNNNSEAQVSGRKQKQSATPKKGHDGKERKEKKSKKKKKSGADLFNFDLEKVPLSVSWVLSNTDEEGWTAFLGDEPVTKTTRQLWDAAFYLATKKR